MDRHVAVCLALLFTTGACAEDADTAVGDPAVSQALDEAELALQALDADDPRNFPSFSKRAKAWLVLQAVSLGDSRAIEWFMSDGSTGEPGARFFGGREWIDDRLVRGAFDGTDIDVRRLFVDRDMVVAHVGITTSSESFVGFVLFRFENGLVVETREALAPEIDDGDGTTQLDGERRVRDRSATRENLFLVTRFIETAYVEGDWTSWPTFINEDAFVEHAAGLGSGSQTFDAMVDGSPVYSSLEFVHGKGNFVLTISEAASASNALAGTMHYDLFRVSEGRIVERWDVVQEASPLGTVLSSN